MQAAKAGGANPNLGIDGVKGVLADMPTLGVWDTFAVKVQTLKTAIEVCNCAAWCFALPWCGVHGACVAACCSLLHSFCASTTCWAACRRRKREIARALAVAAAAVAARAQQRVRRRVVTRSTIIRAAWRNRVSLSRGLVFSTSHTHAHVLVTSG